MAVVLKGFVNMLQCCLTALSSSKVLVHQQEIELQRNVQFIQVIMKIVKIVTTCFSIRLSLFRRSQWESVLGKISLQGYYCSTIVHIYSGSLYLQWVYNYACKLLYIFINVSDLPYSGGKLMVIKFDSLPSKCILLILMDYNLTDQVSTTTWYNNYTKLALCYNIKQAQCY